MPFKRKLVSALSRLWSFVPYGGSLPEPVWSARRQFLVGLTWFHAAAIALIGPVFGYRWDVDPGAFLRDGTVLHTIAEGAIVGLFAAVGGWRRASRTVQATAVGFGLMSSSAILVHLSGGYIELHFHFFVMLVFLALLQDWTPYILAVAYVAIHHGVIGVLWPEDVFNHSAAFAAPWTWAGIHAFFVLWSCVGSVIAWRFNEQASAQTAMILEAVGEGIFGLDRDGNVTFLNRGAANLLGTDARLAVGRHIGEILRHARADGVRILPEKCPLLSPVRDGTSRHASEERFERMDGTSFQVDYVSAPIVERSVVTGVVVTFQDITVRKRAEVELQRSHARLEEALAELKATQRQVLQQERLRAVGQMASGIAHDFNNSLTPIMSYSELLLQKPDHLDAEQTERYMKVIHTAACDAAAVVGRLRELYRERGEAPPDAAVDVVDCVEQAIALTQPRWKNQALAAGITINIDTELRGAPGVAGDATEIREALTNLIFNAVDAMPTGGTITIRAFAEGDLVRLEVEDTGIGMAEDVRARCAEPFFSTKGPHGSGLGLPMVAAIVDRHRGSYTIDSELARGTRIILRLPQRALRAIGRAEAQSDDRMRRLRILVVEDEAVVRKSIIDVLAADGHTIDSATNGVEGLEKVMGAWFDLVITDRAMPEMGGDQLAAAVKRMMPDKPIVMLTGFGELMAARGDRPAGVDVVVSKPVTRSQLQSAVAQATAR
jgi:PAS domain S-box-containing protein